jgi:integrase/recombinase XerD
MRRDRRTIMLTYYTKGVTMSAEQPMLFDADELDSVNAPGSGEGESEPPGITATTPLSEAMLPFQQFMKLQGFTDNTIYSFLGDMDLAIRRLGARTPLGDIRTRDLDGFLQWLAEGREAPCSPKSYARRVTTLKVFFKWLADAEVLPRDPAARVIQLQAQSPLPQTLYDSQIADVLNVTRELMLGEEGDARPHLIVTLVLNTGIKKSECMGLKHGHFDLSDPDRPALWVRYDQVRYRLKERRLSLPSEVPSTLRRYLDKYAPREHIFPCTPRNLEYVLKDVAQRANLPNGLSFEMLRWTCAVRDYRGGMNEDLLRRKLGLSPITWRDTLLKIEKLAEEPL